MRPHLPGGILVVHEITGTSPRRVSTEGTPRAWPNRPSRNRGPPPAPLGHDGALVRSTSTPGSPHRVRPRRQPRGRPMSEVDLILAFLAGVVMGVVLDRLRAAAPRRCLDRPNAPAWAMSVRDDAERRAGPTSTPRPGSGPLRRSRSSWPCSSSSTSPSPTTTSPPILLPLLGAIFALLGLEASAVWRGVK